MPCRLLVSFLILISTHAFAGLSCDMSKTLQSAAQGGKLGDNFWQEYAKLSKNGIGDRELGGLLRKHGVGVPESPANGRRISDIVSTKRVRPVVERTVVKEVQRLSPLLKQKYGEVVERLTLDPSGKSFYAQPGRWHFEKLPQYGNYAHSVRLDNGYRVLFDIQNGVARIRQVDKTIGH